MCPFLSTWLTFGGSLSGMQPNDKMTATELRGSLSLASVLFLRMLGLFLILPVFTLYARTLTESTPTLIGLAFGIYGLTQASLQIPFGMLSDKLGRKPVIFAGLLIFAAGSLIASQADSIWLMILGRALQGAGQSQPHSWLWPQISPASNKEPRPWP